MGIRKGLNKFITQIFVVQENEIQISSPTNVKHVAHIGFDGAPGSAPSWMGKLESGPNFALSSIGASGSSLQPLLSSQDVESKRQRYKTGEVVGKETSSSDVVPPRAKKQKRKKKKKKSETPSSSTRHRDGVKTNSSTTRSKLIEQNVNSNIEVP